MNKLQVIQKRRAKLTGDVANPYADRQQRLKNLVDKHGVKFVAEASGLSENTLIQYVRTSNPPSISEQAVSIAERVLEGL